MPYKFSPSSLSLLKDCPRCFWLQFNKGVKRPSGIFPSLPSGMDRVLKEHFDSFRDKGRLPPELKELDGEYRLFDDKALLDDWRNNFRGIRWIDGQGNILMGAVDNLLVHKGRLVVLDFKTRGYPCKDDTHEHYQDQMDLYNFLLRKNGHKTEDYAYLLFYHPNKINENGDAVFHSDLKKMKISTENAQKIFDNALKTLNGLEPRAAEECGYCNWNKSK